MLHFNMLYSSLTVAFRSLLGDVLSSDIARAFDLMGKGMLGIFIVMALIWAVIAILNRATGGKKKDE